MQAQTAAIVDWKTSRRRNLSRAWDDHSTNPWWSTGDATSWSPHHSYHLAQHIPGAQLIVYPGLRPRLAVQYPQLFVADVARFLDRPVALPERWLDGFR